MRTKIVTRNVEGVLAAFALLAGCAEDPRIAKEAAEPAPVSVEKEPCRGNDCVSQPAEELDDAQNDEPAARDEDAAAAEPDEDVGGAADEGAGGAVDETAGTAADENAGGAADEGDEGAADEGAGDRADEDAEGATDDGAEGAPGDDVEPTDEAGADEVAPEPTSDPAPDADSHTNSDAPAMTGGEGDSSGDPVVPVTDACDPNPCQHGGTCSDASGNASCLCPDGFEGPHCEIRFCGSATIRSRADLDALRECSEIRGDLRIASVGLAAIEANDLPLLTKITGHLAISGTHVSDQPLLQSVTLKNLRTIEGTLMVLGLAVPEFGGSGPLRELHLPALESVGVHDALGLAVVQASLATLDLPALKTIEGAILLDTAFELCTVNVSNVESVDGALTVRYVPNLSPAQLEPLRAGAAGPVSEQLLGCCEASPEDGAACEAFTENARALYCGGCG